VGAGLGNCVTCGGTNGWAAGRGSVTGRGWTLGLKGDGLIEKLVGGGRVVEGISGRRVVRSGG